VRRGSRRRVFRLLDCSRSLRAHTRGRRRAQRSPYGVYHNTREHLRSRAFCVPLLFMLRSWLRKRLTAWPAALRRSSRHPVRSSSASTARRACAAAQRWPAASFIARRSSAKGALRGSGSNSGCSPLTCCREPSSGAPRCAALTPGRRSSCGREFKELASALGNNRGDAQNAAGKNAPAQRGAAAVAHEAHRVQSRVHVEPAGKRTRSESACTATQALRKRRGSARLHICACLPVSWMRPCGAARSRRVSTEHAAGATVHSQRQQRAQRQQRQQRTFVACTKGMDLRTCSWMK
jgi:hypothetical protein